MIGINTAIRANAAGIGFAIPIDTAEKAMKVLSTGVLPKLCLAIALLASTRHPDPCRAKCKGVDSSLVLALYSLLLAGCGDAR